MKSANRYSMLKFVVPTDEVKCNEWFGKAFGKGRSWEKLDYDSFVQPSFTAEFIEQCRADPGRERKIPPSGVFSSVTSAMHAFGDRRGAKALSQHIQASTMSTDPMHLLTHIVQTELKGWDVAKALTGDKAAAFDCLTNRSDHPRCIQIHDSDGGAGHCVTIMGDWVFDSNDARALPLCQDSLDQCTGYATYGTRFVCCVKILQLVPGRKLLGLLNKRKRKLVEMQE